MTISELYLACSKYQLSSLAGVVHVLKKIMSVDNCCTGDSDDH